MPLQVPGTIKVMETDMTQDEALSNADMVVAGVPSKEFVIKVGFLLCWAAQLRPLSSPIARTLAGGRDQGGSDLCQLLTVPKL